MPISRPFPFPIENKVVNNMTLPTVWRFMLSKDKDKVLFTLP